MISAINSSNNMTPDLSVEAWSRAMLTPQMYEVVLADVNHFINYLKKICSFILDSSLNSIDVDQSFIDELSYNSIQRFINHDQCQALFISKIHSITDYSSSSSFNLCAISNEDCQINSNYLSLILLKRNLTIVNGISYQEQLQFIYLLDLNQQKVLLDASADRSCIDLPEIILTTAATDDQTIKKLIGTMIQTSTNSNNQDQHDEVINDNIEAEDMVIFKFAFTGALNNINRARVYDAIVAYSLRTASQNTSNAQLYIRRTADPNFIFQPNEQFSVVFVNQASCMSFEAWLSREYTGSHHVLTIIEPTSCAMNIIV